MVITVLEYCIKINNPDESVDVQEKLFNMSYRWMSGCKVSYTDANYIILLGTKHLVFSTQEDRDCRSCDNACYCIGKKIVPSSVFLGYVKKKIEIRKQDIFW